LAANKGNPHGSSTYNSTINYEVDHTIEHVKQPIGRLRRISAAVVINDLGAAAAGAKTGSKPGDSQAKTQTAGLPPARLAQLKALVRAAIGYSVARGDTVEIVNLPFTQPSGVQTAPRPPWWRNPRFIPLAEKLLKYLVVAVGAWLLWRKLIKPLLDRTPELFPARLTTESEAEETADTEARLRQQRRQQQGTLIETAQGLARDDPRMVAMILKSWMNDGG
jgi:flagellar M-ring protein FliF